MMSNFHEFIHYNNIEDMIKMDLVATRQSEQLNNS